MKDMNNNDKRAMKDIECRNNNMRKGGTKFGRRGPLRYEALAL